MNLFESLFAILACGVLFGISVSILAEEIRQLMRSRRRKGVNEFSASCKCVTTLHVSSLGLVEPAHPTRPIRGKYVMEHLAKHGIKCMFDAYDDGGSNYIIFEGVDYGQAIVDFMHNGYSDLNFAEFMEKLIGS